MKNKILTVLVVVLVLLNVFSVSSSSQMSASIQAIQSKVNNLPKEPIVYVGKDGYTPVKGVDYRDGVDGKAGINSISFVTTETIVKEVPLVGVPGLDGLDAPTLKIQVNPDTRDIETRLSNERGWGILVLCADYRNECPSAD